MKVLRKLERDFAVADLKAVSDLLNQLTDEDVMVRFSLESRKDQIERHLTTLNEGCDSSFAAAALFFGGRPVISNRGIEADFGTEIIEKFQDLTSNVLAQESGGLGQRGMVPNRAASTLHITNIVRGSFGFLLEELDSQEQIVESSLKNAIAKTSLLLDALREPGEERFQVAVEFFDQRVLSTADFFLLMRQADATLRLVAGEFDRSFSVEDVARAADRAMTTSVEDATEMVSGVLTGILPEARQFEFRIDERSVVRGIVDRSISPEQLHHYNASLLNVSVRARVKIKRLLRNNVVVRESFTLLAIDSR